MAMEQKIEHRVVQGNGSLATKSGSTPVRYRLGVYQHIAVQENMVIGRGRRESKGSVELIDEPHTIADGTWILQLASGERWKVENDNGNWTRLAD